MDEIKKLEERRDYADQQAAEWDAHGYNEEVAREWSRKARALDAEIERLRNETP